MSFNPLFLLAAIPIFGLVVIIHEFGHFIVAKWSGIRVDEFAIGFPPRLGGFKRGETTYSINLLPLGGYVRMPGENGETVDADGKPDPRTFGAKPAGKRALVLLAGVTMNLLLAIVLFAAAEAVGRVEYRPVIASVEAGSPAQQAGVQAGDRILAVNGKTIKYFSDLQGIVGTQVQGADAAAQSVPVTLVVQHQGNNAPTTLTVAARTHPGPKEGYLGISRSDTEANTVHLRAPLWQAPALGVQDIGKVAVGTYEGIRAVVRGLIPANQAFQGPVGIVKYSGEAAAAVPQVGLYPIFFLTGLLSLNLAFFNLLPIPGLDGGRLLFIVIEVLRRGKRISPQREGLVHLAGFAALLALVVLVTINDVSNFGH